MSETIKTGPFAACENRIQKLCEAKGLVVFKLEADEDGILLSVDQPDRERQATYKTGRMSEILVNRWIQEQSDGVRNRVVA